MSLREIRCFMAGIMMTSIAAGSAACHQPAGESDASVDSDRPKVYRVRYGMSVAEFSATNATHDIETSGLGMSIPAPHILIFEVEDQKEPFVLRNVGRSVNASTFIALDYNIDDVEKSTIMTVSATLDGGDDDSNMTFAQAERACEQAVSGFAGTEWKDRTQSLVATYKREGRWLEAARADVDIKAMPDVESFPRKQFVNGPLLAECVIRRNSFVAPDYGFQKGLWVYGNDATVPMYIPRLSLLSREELEPNWRDEDAEQELDR